MTAMRNRICLAAAVLCALAGEPAAAQSGSILERKVTVTFNDAPLESVLRTLRRQYGVRISYSNTALNLRQPVTLNAQNQPLRAVLGEVLRDKNIGYELVGDQLVLHPAAPKPTLRPTSPAAPAAATTTTVSRVGSDKTSDDAAAVTSRSASLITEATKVTAKDAPAPTPVESKAPAPKAGSKSLKPKAAPKATNSATKATSKTTKFAPAKASAGEAGANQPAAKSETATNRAAAASPTESADPTTIAPKASPNSTVSGGTGAVASTAGTVTAPATPPTGTTPAATAQDTTAAAAPAEAEQPARPTFNKRAQISFLGPLGSNGLRSGQTVNDVSVNVLGGYSAGVNGFEAAGLFNVTRDSVQGVQLAGLSNIVGRRVEGFQGAGMFNVVGGGGTGWQAAGLFNLTTRPLEGAQTAGLFNVAGPAKKSVSDEPTAAAATASGGKLALQAAGLFNVALGEVKGVQAAGLFNVGGKVRGTQLAGLLNVADSVSGVSIAPLNFVRRGYHRLEAINSEVWPVSASLKLGGSPAFYTFFTGAYNGFGNDSRRWSLGYGVGSEVWARRRVSLAIDAVAMHVNEESSGWTRDLNMHHQLRLLVGLAPFRAGGRIRLVAGPTVSLLVTERYDSTEQRVYSRLSEGRPLWLDEGSAFTKVQGWFGYCVGVRF